MADDIARMTQDAIASSEAFKRQFDKTNPSYHGGDPTPVPLGGNRIPKSMEGPVDDTPKIDEAALGPSFRSVSDLRSLVIKMQTELNAIHRVMHSIHAEYSTASRKESAGKEPESSLPNAATLASLHQNKNKMFSALKSLLVGWSEPLLEEPYLSSSTRSATAATVSSIKSSMENILADSEKICEEDPKEAVLHQQFVTTMRPLLQQLNRHKVTLLQTIKDMKKEFSAHNKAFSKAGEKIEKKKSEDSEEVLN